ncbi:UDP-2,4-diacetamido-2,4,6-trideoxy-beta-L-altropyranose hydrolase [Marinagarivorans cellulosilyticus]|uniref:UDP-2,4-diacetamido-2,4, 6-trideoxy-beta-L-altropyranose hydrolase n=1 Tax=Marinagarivorans cellulosilyticus TaxID=2721545 RepID=A0AAN2BLQ7_9GAMM|nr:UDP-2,4-diacetamido-2,4,6-trideoxy-beta-L-altropyranose hydrolase [Marinagarivorans cellulosilyticus]BCD99287.1 hypothetical protein MARGE09_P3488 [Marinagarivorans cellulosilyticus]
MASGTVLFRVDASHFLGNGHVVRCVALAETLIEHGYCCVFACRDLAGNAIDWLQRKNFDVVVLPTPEKIIEPQHNDFSTWGQSDPQWDAQNSAFCLQHYCAAWLVIDHYAWSAAEHELLKPLAAKTLVIDDLCNRPLAADILVDSGSHMNADYDPWLKSSSTRLLGREYLPLRKKFRSLRSVTYAKADIQSHFLISCGATDAANYSLALLKIVAPVLAQGKLRVTCVLAANAPHIQQLKDYCQSHRGTQLVIDPDDMAGLIASTDFVIGTAGSGVWERCALGKPSAVLMAGEDQRNNFNSLVQFGGGCDITKAANCFAICRDKVLYLLKQWYEKPYSDLYQHQKSAWELCDGQGAKRIAQKMQQAAA